MNVFQGFKSLIILKLNRLSGKKVNTMHLGDIREEIYFFGIFGVNTLDYLAKKSQNTRFTALDGTGNIVDFQLTAVPPLVLSRFWIFKWLVSQLKRPTNLKKKPRSLPVYIGNTVACFHSKKENKIYVLFRSFDNKDLSEILKESKPLNFLMWFDDR